MQRPDGSFRHLYDPQTKQPTTRPSSCTTPGEAALALARMYVVTQDPRYAQAAERALDWLVDWYDFFVGGFFYGEEHWTCIAAEAIWPAVQKPKYREFCNGYGAFLRQQQPEPGDIRTRTTSPARTTSRRSCRPTTRRPDRAPRR